MSNIELLSNQPEVWDFEAGLIHSEDGLNIVRPAAQKPDTA